MVLGIELSTLRVANLFPTTYDKLADHPVLLIGANYNHYLILAKSVLRSHP